ncbi:hypothetical protein SNE40_013255 [Patella caerulea]|uniref:Fucolectin tachylectin-4 pentraxin-1 domain-containing protein n=1 Tax=Patella caerulea TaxID=87958 RepID=A0AAN8PNQ3_PATCE
MVLIKWSNAMDWKLNLTWYGLLAYLIYHVGILSGQNVAFMKSAIQSSVYLTNTADNAVDGNNSTDFYSDSCVHTAVDNNQYEWWEVDLGATYDITDIIIFNRVDCCGERLQNFTIQGGVDCGTPGPKCYTDCYKQADIVVVSERISCNNCTARYIKISLDYVEEINFCEVEIYGQLSSGSPGTQVCSKYTGVSSSLVSSEYGTPSMEPSSVFSEYSSSVTELHVSSLQVVSSENFPSSAVEPSSVFSGYSSSVIEVSSLLVVSSEDFPSSAVEPSTSNSALSTSNYWFSSSYVQLLSSTYITHSTTSNPVSVTNVSVVQVVSNEFCSCSCKIINEDPQVLEDKLAEIKQNLTVNTVKLSSTIRKKTSAPDNRPSAVSVGYMGIVTLSVVFGFFVLQDLITALLYVLGKLNWITGRSHFISKTDTEGKSQIDKNTNTPQGYPPNDSRLPSILE